VLSDLSMGRVFLDSDDLLDLMSLFGTVGSDVETLVVLCTQDVLLRPYCLGEITTACMDKVRTRSVNIEFQDPTDDFISSIDQIMDLQCLYEVGMSLESMQESLRWFRTLEALCYPVHGTIPELVAFCRQLQLNRSVVSEQPASIQRSIRLNPRSDIMIACDSSNPNSLAAASILLKFVPAHEWRATLFHEMMSEASIPDSDRTSFRCLAAICTSGCWHDMEFLLAFQLAREVGAKSLAVIADDYFVVPNSDTMKNLEARLEFLGLEATPIMDAVASTFKKIALPLAVMASSSTVETQCKGIVARLVSFAEAPRHSASREMVASTSVADFKNLSRTFTFHKKTQSSSPERVEVSSETSTRQDTPDDEEAVGKIFSV